MVLLYVIIYMYAELRSVAVHFGQIAVLGVRILFYAIEMSENTLQLCYFVDFDILW